VAFVGLIAYLLYVYLAKQNGAPSNHAPSSHTSSSHHSPSPPPSSTLTPNPQGMGTTTSPVSVSSVTIDFLNPILLDKWQWDASSTELALDSSPSLFDLSVSKGIISVSQNPDLCVGIDTSSSPISGAELTVANVRSLSEARLKNFIWNIDRLPMPQGVNVTTGSPQPLGFCLTRNNALCAGAAGTSFESPQLKLYTNEGDWSTGVWLAAKEKN